MSAIDNKNNENAAKSATKSRTRFFSSLQAKFSKNRHSAVIKKSTNNDVESHQQTPDKNKKKENRKSTLVCPTSGGTSPLNPVTPHPVGPNLAGCVMMRRHPQSTAARHSPANCSAELACRGWFWGPLTRSEASALLSHAPHSSFLVRDSEREPGRFTLTFRGGDVTNANANSKEKHGDVKGESPPPLPPHSTTTTAQQQQLECPSPQIFHNRILHDERGRFALVPGEFFNSVPELIAAASKKSKHSAFGFSRLPTSALAGTSGAEKFASASSSAATAGEAAVVSPDEGGLPDDAGGGDAESEKPRQSTVLAAAPTCPDPPHQPDNSQEKKESGTAIASSNDATPPPPHSSGGAANQVRLLRPLSRFQFGPLSLKNHCRFLIRHFVKHPDDVIALARHPPTTRSHDSQSEEAAADPRKQQAISLDANLIQYLLDPHFHLSYS